MAKLYQYVGPEGIKRRLSHDHPGVRIESVADLENWIGATGQRPNQVGLIAVTFIVDEQGFVRVADRGSEHLTCSGGAPVLSAGEMFVRFSNRSVEVAEVSNQSTGFCPEPESWPAVAAALDQIGMPHPGRFTQEIVFRKCRGCGGRNIVKEGWFVCDLCGADLPSGWNF